MSSTRTTSSTAVVTGAGRGFGRAIAVALAAEGWQVVGISRDPDDLAATRAAASDRFTPVPADATDATVATDVIRTHRPSLLVLNAGATPRMDPIHELTWDDFSRNWNTDTHHVFEWVAAALREPLDPGSLVVPMSSGAALHGSPLSGGYAGAKATIRYVSDYAAAEAERMNLGIRFATLYPALSPSGIGAVGVSAYAARQGVDEDAFVAALQPVLTPELVAQAVIGLAAAPDGAPAYVLTGSGPKALDR